MKNKLSLLLVSFFLFSCAENKQVTEQQTTFCNPMNLDYGWGCFQKREKKARTAADPVIVLFKDKIISLLQWISAVIVYPTT